MIKNQKRWIPLIMYVVIVLITILLLTAGSCAFSTDGLVLITGDYSSPKLEDFTLQNEQNASISFSHTVSFPVLEYYEVPFNEGDENAEAIFLGEVRQCSSEEKEGVYKYHLDFPEKLSASKKYILSGTVKDDIGSTLSFTVGYSGYNSRVPKMIFSEISTEYSNPRTEFIEFYILEDGNLAGVLLQSAHDGPQKDYTFPSVEVKKGDYVVLHMRTVEETAVNELDENLALSVSKQSNPESRDLWISGKETRLSQNDVLILRERFNGSIIDSVAYRDGEKSTWAKSSCELFIQEAVTSFSWQGSVAVNDAIDIQYITGTRTLCRQNISEIITLFDNGIEDFPNSKENWIIVATSNVSPGEKNSETAYVK